MAKTKAVARTKVRPPGTTATRGRGGSTATKPLSSSLPGHVYWADELVFNVREPKLAVSLRLDADVLRCFRSPGARY